MASRRQPQRPAAPSPPTPPIKVANEMLRHCELGLQPGIVPLLASRRTWDAVSLVFADDGGTLEAMMPRLARASPAARAYVAQALLLGTAPTLTYMHTVIGGGVLGRMGAGAGTSTRVAPGRHGTARAPASSVSRTGRMDAPARRAARLAALASQERVPIGPACARNPLRRRAPRAFAPHPAPATPARFRQAFGLVHAKICLATLVAKPDATPPGCPPASA